MNIFIIIAIFIIIYAFINFRKAFLIYLIFGLFLNQNINLLNIPGIPLLTLNTGMSFFFIVFFYLNRQKINFDKSPFPFKAVFILSTVSYIISMLFAIAGIGNTFSAVIKVILEDYLMVWLIWLIVKDKNDMFFLIKGFTIVFAFAALYGIYEFVTHNNPIAQYEMLIGGAGDRVLDFAYSDESERGYRIRSIFFHVIGAGLNFSLYFFIISYLWMYYNRFFKFKPMFLFIVGFMCLLCAILTKQRTPIVFLLIGSIPLFISKGKSVVLIVSVLIFSFFIVKNIPNFLDNFSSLYDRNASEKVGGSNLEMRMDQLDAALTMFNDSPILGLGPKATLYYKNINITNRLFGLESVWFWIIIERGLLGVISYFYFIYILFKLGKKNKLIFFLSMSFVITSTMTSTPGFNLQLFFLLIIILLKTDVLQLKMKYLNKNIALGKS